MNDPPRVLITAGPTHEPIDQVRFIANRSSGRMGLALVEATRDRSLVTTLLLGPGPTPSGLDHSQVALRRFRTTADLQALLGEEWPRHDILFMAAAVADFRPKSAVTANKLRRTARGLSLQLEPTPDLLADLTRSRRSDQFIVGFALEPESDLLGKARAKLRQKGIDAIVANPLETMHSDLIDGVLITADGTTHRAADGMVSKRVFAAWLLDTVVHLAARRDSPETHD